MTDLSPAIIIAAAALLLFGVPLAAALCLAAAWLYNLFH